MPLISRQSEVFGHRMFPLKSPYFPAYMDTGCVDVPNAKALNRLMLDASVPARPGQAACGWFYEVAAAPSMTNPEPSIKASINKRNCSGSSLRTKRLAMNAPAMSVDPVTRPL